MSVRTTVDGMIAPAVLKTDYNFIALGDPYRLVHWRGGMFDELSCVAKAFFAGVGPGGCRVWIEAEWVRAECGGTEASDGGWVSAGHAEERAAPGSAGEHAGHSDGYHNDSLLKPLREMAGVAAPGDDIGGWYSYRKDFDFRTDTVGFAPSCNYGQWVSALARNYGMTGDTASRDKVLQLNRSFAETIGVRYFDVNRFPAYCYDKQVCGLMDSHRLVQDPDAFRLLDASTNAVVQVLPETCCATRCCVASESRCLVELGRELHVAGESLPGVWDGSGASLPQAGAAVFE